MRKLILTVGFVIGMVPLVAAGADVTATEGRGERLAKTAAWAGACGAVAGWAVPVVTGLHAVGAVGVGTGVGAPLGVVAFATGAAACGFAAGWDYFEPERKGLGEAIKNEARATSDRLMRNAETLRKKYWPEVVERFRDVRWP